MKRARRAEEHTAVEKLYVLCAIYVASSSYNRVRGRFCTAAVVWVWCLDVAFELAVFMLTRNKKTILQQVCVLARKQG